MSDAVVIGAGAAGLSVAAMLRCRGVAPVVLEAGRVGESWRRRYDRLRLNSTADVSSLPGWRIPREHGRWVHRDEYVDYLERYAGRHDVVVRRPGRGDRSDRDDDGDPHGAFVLRTSAGDTTARAVVVATGHDRVAHTPRWPGRDAFCGQLVHAEAYRRPEPFAGRRVLVVGAGNSGFEIALDLAEGGAAEVLLAVRTPPIVLAHEWHGIPVTAFARLARPLPAPARDVAARLLQRAMFGDLAPHGLPRPARGLSAQLALDRLPTIDKGTVAAIRRGQIEVVAGLERFEGPDAVLADGRRVRADVVLAATAYRPALEPLVGHLGALDAEGRPRAGAVPGLAFAGFRVPLTGLLAQHRPDAPRIARSIAAHLATYTRG